MRMDKTHAIKVLGGTPAKAARAVGISSSAVSQWPDVLPPAIADRVIAALAKQHLPPELLGSDGAPEVPAPAEASAQQAGG